MGFKDFWLPDYHGRSESPLVALYFALSSDEDAKTDAAVWVLNPMRLNKKVGYGEYVPPISYDSLRGDLEGAFSNHDNDDYGLQNRIIACHGVGCDLRMYVQQSDFTIHSTAERLDQILKLDESCDYFYKIRIKIIWRFKRMKRQSSDISSTVTLQVSVWRILQRNRQTAISISKIEIELTI